MSNETNVATESAGNDPTVAIKHEVVEASTTNCSGHSNGNNQVEEQQQQQQQQFEEVESTKHIYDDNDQQMYNKNDFEAEVLRKVFIGGLSYRTDDQNFRDYFSNYGDIVVRRERSSRQTG